MWSWRCKSRQDVAGDPHEVLESWHDKIREVIVRTNLVICRCMSILFCMYSSLVCCLSGEALAMRAGEARCRAVRDS